MPELVALTGATGFIGTALTNSFSQAGIKVRALSRKTRASDKSVEWVQGDMHSPLALEKLVKDADTVIHCAGNVRGKSKQEFLSINQVGTENLLAACKNQKNIQRFLLISSLAAKQPHLSWYAFSKHAAEQTLSAYKNNFPSSTVFRPTAVYGPGDKEIRPLLKGIKMGLLVKPDAKTNFSLIHINDLVSAINLWARHPTPVNGVYELDDGTANGYNWDKLIDLAQQHWGKSVHSISIPIGLLKILANTNLKIARLLRYSPMLTPGKVCEILYPDWVCDNSDLSSALKWHPSIQLSHAMQEPSLLDL
jgi:nucleoside-diphosphate-sugar epimerase